MIEVGIASHPAEPVVVGERDVPAVLHPAAAGPDGVGGLRADRRRDARGRARSR